MKRFWFFFFLLLRFVPSGFGHFNPFSRALFVENRGQWPAEVRYKLERKGHQIWLENNALTFQIMHSDASPLGLVHAEREGRKVEKANILSHTYRVRFVGSRMPRSEGSDFQNTTFNYFFGADASQWISGARACESVTYFNLYDGIDLKLYGEGDRMKYDFYLKAKANPAKIKLHYEGVESLRLRNGKLLIPTALGQVEERIPRAWQLIEGGAKNLRCQYVLNGKTVGFSFPDGYDSRYPIVIDPVIQFFTYSGAGSDNWGNTAVSDSAGNAYTAGTVYGNGYPTTLGVYDRSYNGSNINTQLSTYDIGILKFDPSGKKLLWCTYLGGAEADSPYSLAIDPNQNLMVMGTTSSTNFPTTVGAFQRTHKKGPVEYPHGTTSDTNVRYPHYQNGSDLFVSRLQADGKKLMGSTFIGGSNTDGLMSINDRLVANYSDQFRSDLVIGEDGSVYVASHTKSADFPVLQPYQGTLKGSQDGVVLKMDGSLSEIIWSTYLGGNRLDALYSLHLIGGDKLVVTGGSTSSDFPTLAGAYQRTGVSGTVDAVVAILSQQSGQFLGGTYSQTAFYDQAYLVQSDPSGNIYIFGQTKGLMPLSQGVYGQAGGGQFVQKFSPSLSTLLWGTTFGTTPGQPNIVPAAFLVDSCSHIFMSGWGGRLNYKGDQQFAGGWTIGLPVTSDAFQSQSDSSDFYFLVLNQDAKGIIFGSYYGQNGGRGEHVDGGTSRFDRRGIVTQAICGCIDQDNGSFFEGTPGSYQPSVQSSNCNNGVMKLNLFDLVAKIKPQINTQIQCPLTLSFNNLSVNGVSYTWYFGNGDSLSSTSPTIQYQYQTPGTYTIRLKAVNPRTCRYVAYDDTTIVIPDPFPFEPDTLQDLFCAGDTLHPVFEELAPYSVSWSPKKWVSDPASYKPDVYPLGSMVYTLNMTNTAGCKSKKFYEVKNRKLTLDFEWFKTAEPCSNLFFVEFKSTKDTTAQMTWDFGDGATAVGQSVKHTYSKAGRYEVSLNGSLESCAENAFKTLIITEVIEPVQPLFTTEKSYNGCNKANLVFKNQSSESEGYLWDFGDGYQSTEFEPIHSYEKPGIYKVKLQAFKNHCKSEQVQEVVVEDLLVPSLITSNNDAKNEVFKISGLEPGAGLELYDRWGKKIFETDHYLNDWKPDKVEAGTYFFNIQFSNETQCNGWVEIVR